MNETPAARLGRLVKESRLRLGLTHATMRAAGGPGPSTIQKVEQGRGEDIGPAVQVALERSLKWDAGWVRRILAGEDPASFMWALQQGIDSGGNVFTASVDLGEPPSEAERRELQAAAEAEIRRRWREIRNPPRASQDHA